MSDEREKRGVFPTVVNSIIWIVKKPVIWLLCLVAISSPYFIVHYLKLVSSDMYINGKYAEAKYYSGISLKIAEIIYPPDYYIDQYKTNLKINYGFPHYGTEADADEPLKNIVIFSKFNEDNLPYSAIFDLYVYGAQIRNGNYWGNGGALASFALDEAKRRSYQNDLYTAKAKEEVAYSDLVRFYASLAPKTKKDVELNNFVFSEVEGEHNLAQAVICKNDIVACKFNRIRWFIGACIRAGHLDANKTLCDINRDFLDQVSALCQGLNDNECAAIRNDLAPYFHTLIGGR